MRAFLPLLGLAALVAGGEEEKLGIARGLETYGRWSEAADAYREAGDVARSSYALFRAGRHEEAEKAYRWAMLLPAEQQWETLYSEAARSSHRLGDLDAAIRRSEIGTERFPDSPFPWASLGWYLSLKGKDVDARDAYGKAATRAYADTGPCHGTRLSLPFRGRWEVLQGNAGRHSHLGTRNRFAWDFRGIDAKGVAVRGGGKRNEDHVSFGLAILAPADGLVVDALDGIEDNVPGERDTVNSEGNFVYVEHAPGEVSRVFHLKKGSVAVKPGQRVKRGDLLGRCGNSGNSTGPHVCFALATDKPPRDVSMPARFASYTRIRKWQPMQVENGVPEPGQWVEGG